MAANGRNTTMDGLIRRSLANTTSSGDNCPGSEILAAYYERSLDPSATAGYERHLSGCPRCREQLAIMVRADEKPRPAGHRGWLGDWRFLASAAMALLMLAVWGVRRTVLPSASPNANEPLVAMSRPEQGPSRQPAQHPQPSLQLPPTAPRETTVAPRALDRARAKTGTGARTPRDEMQVPPLNGRNYDHLLKGRPEAEAAEPPSPLAEGKKEEAKSPRAGVPPMASPNRMSAPVAPGVAGAVGGTLGGVAAGADANATTGEESSAKQRELAPRTKSFGAANGGALAQSAEQRSATTIIQTPDPKVLWRIAGGNFVERTENGGATWRGQVADPDAQLTTGAAPTTKVCWLAGKSGMILLTKDTTHWKKIPPPVPADFVSIEAKNASSAIVTAPDGQKFSTDDGGKKWVPARR